MQDFPKHGIVPMFRQLTRIERVNTHPKLGTTYVLHTKDPANGLIIHYNMLPEQILEAINDYAAFKVGQEVRLHRYGSKVIAHRRWSFREGKAYYKVADPRKNVASGWIPEERLKGMIDGGEEELPDLKDAL